MNYCTNCGNETKSKICNHCGVKNNRVHNYCYWCGEKLNAYASICTHCKESTKTGASSKIRGFFASILVIVNVLCILDVFRFGYGAWAIPLWILSALMVFPFARKYILMHTHNNKHRKFNRFLFNSLRIFVAVVLLLMTCVWVEYTESNSSENNSSKLSTYTYDEYVMYSTMTKGYGKIMDSLKNPKSADFLGISYNADANIAYYCVIAENDFGGNTKSYIQYSRKTDKLYEDDSLKYYYDSAEIQRSFDDLLAFMKAAENADESDVPTQGTNEALEAYSKSDREMYELIIAGVDELNIFYDDLLIVGYKYSTDSKDAYFYFTGDDSDGKPVMTYASYSDVLGLMSSDAYQSLYENADVEVYSFEIENYKEATKKDISK